MPLSDFNVRWYHVYSTIAFLVANLWNFQLNRTWTFRTRQQPWWREYLAVRDRRAARAGRSACVLLTLLMHRGSPLALPTRSSTTRPACAPACTGRSSS